MVNNRPVAACTQPITEGMIVLNDTEPLNTYRRNLIDMMFIEGNHLCPVCEKSGNCELQALAYRFGILAPKYPYLFPRRPVDASHPDIFLDQNRCIQCGRCIRASQELDGKSVFQFFGRGSQKKLGVNAEARLADTNLNLTDEAVNSCPVGALLRKRVGYAIPVGQRLYDLQPIGSEIEAKARRAANRK
jgi:[NiFe] hydrogenase diaphorase moiety small subunit